jgi:copper chaperone
MFKTITFEVIGDQRLHCETCEQRVERLLKALQGVGQVRAQAHNQRIEVLFDTAALEATAIAERLSKAGYETRVGRSTSGIVERESHLHEGRLATRSEGRGWIRSLAVLPGALLPLLPSATCPMCLAAYAGVLSAVGLGFLFNERVLGPLIVVFLTIGIFSVAWSTRSHRRLGPLVVTVVGSGVVVAGRLVWNIPMALYTGVGLLVGASLWNLWLKRPRAEPLVQIGSPHDGRCSRCQ